MIVSVASGKGGTGKTLVATSLALSVKGRERIQLLDCDVEEPNAHLFLGPAITHTDSVCVPVPVVDEDRCTHCGKCAEVCAFNAIVVLPRLVMLFPELCHGCGACSYLCPESAIHEEGREVGVVESGQADGAEFVHGKLTVGEAMPGPVIRKVKELARDEGTVIVDVSPGTSCPVVEAVKGSDFCLLVTEPTPFGLSDLKLAIQMADSLGVPCGVVINRDGVGDGRVEEYCCQQGVPILMRIPLDMEIARLYSNGVPLAVGMPRWRQAFLNLHDDIAWLLERGRRK